MRNSAWFRLMAVLALMGAAVAAWPAHAGSASGAWTPTGDLNAPRAYHTATLLADGRVLVAGGYVAGPLATAEVYNPEAGTWATTGSLNTGRVDHTATLLADGRVLVAGGNANGVPLDSAEVYDPATGQWTATGRLNQARQSHIAERLSDGRVLVAGGTDGYDLASAELYDPASGAWTLTGSLHTARRAAQATRLDDGRVLIVGGLVADAVIASAEVYDPSTGQWTPTGSLSTARYIHTTTLLPDGRVLVAGGSWSASYPNPLASAELYDPGTGHWTAAASLHTARYTHSATLLPSGLVLVAGGGDVDLNPLASAELYDPIADQWSATGSLNTARGSHSATLLLDGRVLAAGGTGAGAVGALASAELYGSTQNTMHVGAIQGRFASDPYGRTLLHMRVLALDQNRSPLPGVEVSVAIAVPGGPGSFQRDKMTHANGYARFGTGSNQAGGWQLCVDALSKGGYAYNPDDNVVTCMVWYN